MAIERALSVSYDDFGAHVTAFIEPDHRALYASREAWDTLQTAVLDALEGGST